MRDERDFDRFNAVNCKRIECWRKTRRFDGFCSDRCQLSAMPLLDVVDRDPRFMDGARVPTSPEVRL